MTIRFGRHPSPAAWRTPRNADQPRGPGAAGCPSRPLEQEGRAPGGLPIWEEPFPQCLQLQLPAHTAKALGQGGGNAACPGWVGGEVLAGDSGCERGTWTDQVESLGARDSDPGPKRSTQTSMSWYGASRSPEANIPVQDS